MISEPVPMKYNLRTGRRNTICSDSLVALKALRAIRTSPLVHQCQRALNISVQHVVSLFLGPRTCWNMG